MSSQDPVAGPKFDGSPPPDPFRWNTQPTLACRVRVAGFDVLFESNDERIIEAARRTFNPTGVPLPDTDRHDLTVQLMHHGVEDDPEWQLRIPVVRTNGDLVTISYSRHSSMVVDVRRGMVFGYVTEALASLPAYLCSDVIFASVMCYVYVATNSFVHAGGVTCNGRSVLVRGPSGTGKSTLAYAMVRRGYSLIGDDSIYVRSRTGPVSRYIDPSDAWYYGVPWSMNLLPDAVRFFPEVEGSPTITRPSGEVKFVIEAAALFPERACPEAPAGPLVFLTRADGGRSRVRRLSRDETLARLRSTAVAYEPVSTEPGTLWGLFLHFPCYLLESGPDPNEAAEALDAVMQADDFCRPDGTP